VTTLPKGHLNVFRLDDNPYLQYHPSMTYDTSHPHTEVADFYMSLFGALSGSCVLLKADAPTYTILAATPQYLRATGVKKEDIIGVGIFEAFPANNADPNHTGESDLHTSYRHVMEKCEVHYLPVQRYDIKNEDGSFSERYWRASNTPMFSNTGEVVYILHAVEEITDQIKAEKRESQIKGVEKVFGLFMDAPMVVGLVMGDDYVLEMANKAAFELWGKGSEIISKPILQGLPELQGQGIIELFDQVRNSGEPFYANEVPVTSFVDGKEQNHFFNLTYQPYYTDEGAKATGVFTISYDVTEQVLARKAAQVSEAKYRTLFESMDQGFCVVEMIFDEHGKPIDYRFLETNPVFEHQTGLQNAVGKTARELVPSLEQHWLDLYSEVALSGQPKRFIEGSEAMERWFDVFAFRIDDLEAHKLALLFTDITERRKTEDAIRRSEANLLNVILQAPVAMAILKQPQFIVEIANDRMYELWGRAKEDLMGKSIFEGLPEVRNQGYEELLKGVYETGKRFTALGIPVTLPRNGSIETLYINLLYEAFCEADGTISGVMAVATDVTEQVTARIRIEESHKELQFAIDVMPQMVWVTKPDGYHDLYNRQWYDYTGLPHDKTKGEGWNIVLHPDDQQRAWEVWWHSLETGEPYEIEYRIRRYDGQYRWFLGRALPLRDEEGRITKWFGTCTDVDDQRRVSEIMEQKVAERTRELKQVNDQLKQFAYSASHDLQEPLRKITFFLDRLIGNIGPELSEENKQVMERIQHTTNRMRGLIDDLLAYSNTTLGIMNSQEVPLTETIHDVLEDMEGTLLREGAQVNLSELPNIRGDHRQIRQLFQNLISNAVKYHREGTEPVIQITAHKVHGKDVDANIPSALRKQTCHLIEVKDNGIGFDPDDAERIFGLFQRLHGKAEYEGTGVGLAIVQKVVENHCGYIWAEGAPGQGSTFKVLLPVE
jgi:PAS domain S-box-containing protein